MESSQEKQQQIMCKNGCGFFGTEATQGYCSLCFRKLGKTIEPTPKPAEKQAEVAAPEETKEPAAPVQTDLSKCWFCKRKAGTMPFKCKCGYVFCTKHRIAEEHDCQFDYHEVQRAKIAKENQKVKNNQLEKMSST